MLKNVLVSFVSEQTRYGMTACLVQLAHDFDLTGYRSCGFISPPDFSRVRFLLYNHFLASSSVLL